MRTQAVIEMEMQVRRLRGEVNVLRTHAAAVPAADLEADQLKLKLAGAQGDATHEETKALLAGDVDGGDGSADVVRQRVPPPFVHIACALLRHNQLATLHLVVKSH